MLKKKIKLWSIVLKKKMINCMLFLVLGRGFKYGNRPVNTALWASDNAHPNRVVRPLNYWDVYRSRMCFDLLTFVTFRSPQRGNFPTKSQWKRLTSNRREWTPQSRNDFRTRSARRQKKDRNTSTTISARPIVFVRILKRPPFKARHSVLLCNAFSDLRKQTLVW